MRRCLALFISIFKMKKFIYVLDVLAIFARLLKGERVEGVLYLDKDTHVLTFKAWNRKAPKHGRRRKLSDLDCGWLGETDRHIIRYERFPKSVGVSRIMTLMDDDNAQSKETLIDLAIMDAA